MMTKRDFIRIAECLDANHAPLELVSDFADMCEEDNEHFDRTLFVRAATKNITADLIFQDKMLTKAKES